jgi:glycosyltransferase involved in cell wall biosynthesis
MGSIWGYLKNSVRIREGLTKKSLQPVHLLEVLGNAIVGGVEQYIHNLVRMLPGHGFKVTCLAPYESPVTEALRELGSPVFITRMDDEPGWRSIQFATELVKEQGIQILHAHLPRAQVLAGLVGSLAGVPVVTTIHGMDISSWELGILRTTNAYLSVVCQAAYYQALSLGFPAERLGLVPNGVDLELFQPSNSGAAFRQALGVPESAPVIGFVGRLSHEKGPDMFVDMARKVMEGVPGAHFVMVGDGQMHKELEKRIRSDGLEGNLHLAGIWSRMAEVYPAFDVLAQTSRVEGMPFTLLEAMASGVPVAAMNVGGVGEIVEVGSTGFLAAVGDWAGLGEAVLQLLEEPGLRGHMSEAARQRAEQKFDLKLSTALLAQGFRSLVNSPLPANNLKRLSSTLPASMKHNGDISH